MSGPLSSEFAPKAGYVPHVIEKEGSVERSMDPFSRLLKDRIVYLYEDVNPLSSAVVIAQLLFLSMNGRGQPIHFYVELPGGHVDDGMAIYDTMQEIIAGGTPIYTYATGLSMSMGSVLLVAGSPGCRNALPSARIMLHAPSGGSQGKSFEMGNTQDEIDHMLQRFCILYEAHTGMDRQAVFDLMNKPDFFVRGEEALKLGIIDKVLYPKLAEKINDPALAAHIAKVSAASREANDLHAALRTKAPGGAPPPRAAVEVSPSVH